MCDPLLFQLCAPPFFAMVARTKAAAISPRADAADCYLQIRPNGADSPIVPTFFSIDTDGRVLRIDSFSKFVAPGVRLGFVSGPQALVEKIMNTRESATVCQFTMPVACSHSSSRRPSSCWA